MQIKVTSADGGAPTVLHDRQEQQWPRISPDGTRMAWLLIDPLEPNADIWVEDLARRTRTRVTTAPTRDLGHVWSPDGLRLAYRPDVEDRRRLSIIAADGSGASQDLTCPRAFCEPTDWSSDGRELIVNAYEPGGTDIWAVAVAAGGTSRPLCRRASTNATRGSRRIGAGWPTCRTKPAGRKSPFAVSTGRRDATRSRRAEAIRSCGSATGARCTTSIRKDAFARCRCTQQAAGELSLANPVELPVTIGSGHSNTQYDVAPDGRIYYLDPTPPPLPTEIRIVLGWQRC